MTPVEALLVLEDGTAFRGDSFGAAGTSTGEAVFNTAMAGYQEILTDPSYHRQVVALTSPHQGNYGVNAADAQSARVQPAALVVRDVSRIPSNHRAQGTLPEALRGAGVVGVSGIDTRRLTRHLRGEGAMRAAVSTEVLDVDALVAVARASEPMEGADLTGEVTTDAPYAVGDPARARFRVVAYDFGVKRTLLQLLVASGCAVTVVPATTPASAALADEPDGVFLSNGPGDPAAVGAGISAARALLDAGAPVFGICLGHQILAHALGATTYKLRFGHRGVNQPVRNAAHGGVEITSHNHGFAVDAASLPSAGRFGDVVQTHVNLNDGVNEGLRCTDAPAFSVQYHPEAAPGPSDARYLFPAFTDLMEARRATA